MAASNGSQNKKRKARRLRAETSTSKASAQKRVLKASELAWKPVNDAFDLGFDETGGALALEEIEGVHVVYGEADEHGRRSVQFLAAPSAQAAEESGEEEEWVPLSEQQGSVAESDELQEIAEDYKANVAAAKSLRLDNSALTDALPEYSEFEMHTSLRRAAQRLGFEAPTEIQRQVWQAALGEQAGSRDIVGVAETGSGKTLAYGLPILQSLLNNNTEGSVERQLAALILAPTRELAMQVKTHLDNFIRAACVPEEDADRKRLPFNVVAVTGGMSVQKQRRMLATSGGPDVIVATPGRLADLVEQDRELAKSIRRARFLVLDEADRMIEQGHFAELDTLVGLVSRKKSANDAYEDDFEHAPDSLAAVPAREDLRTYVFSATMSKELQQNLKRSSRRTMRKKEERGKLGALGDLLAKLDFRDSDPLIIDLTPEGGLASMLRECKIDCLNKEKDAFLYYFLLRYPGRTLVFLSSIDAIRRLHPLFELLGLEPGIIHSGMQQRARLKSLERFKSRENGLLFATDVAARGLDVPEVKHVVHFQLPRTADVYVHRSGRTARAGKEGLSLALCSPEEKLLHRSILKSLDRNMEPEDLGVDHSLLDQLRRRLAIATEIDKEQHRVTKANNDEKWLQNAAKDLEMDLSDGSPSDSGVRANGKGKSRRARKAAGGIERMKAELREELARPLRIKGISAKYLTSFANGNSHLADSLIDQSNHDTLLGVRRSTAVDDLKGNATAKRRKRK